MSNNQKSKVLVAMSGGVDSSVAAALLKEQGYSVMGGYMKNFSPESWRGLIVRDCPWEKDMEDIEKVCKTIGIEWRSFNFEQEYSEKVIDYFFDEYAAGRTPNPDAMCNREIKFGVFFEKAMELGFDYIATGHYVRLRAEIPSTKSQIPNKPQTSSYKLYRAKDKNKDQSYFLYMLNQYQLSKSLFPIGEYTKPQVRELARKFGLPNAERKDSQGICFVGRIKLKDFLMQRISVQKGDIVTTNGERIGIHEGVCFYTVGQRQGIGLASGPYYVAEKDVAMNTLVVTKNSLEAVAKECAVSDVYWISGVQPQIPLRVDVKIRYRSDPVPAALHTQYSKHFTLIFDMPQFAVTPGQCAVFYDKEEMLGGGIIES